MLAQLIPIILTASLAGLVLAVGLGADRGDILYVFRRPVLMVKAILAVNVVVPIAAAVMISLFPLPLVVKAGIMLMAVSPVPPLVPAKELKVGGGKAYSDGLYIALVVASVVIVPLTVALLGRVYGHQVAVPAWAVARSVALTVLLPLGVGLGIKRLAPAFATRIAGLVEKAAMVMIVVAFIPLLIAVWPHIVALIGDGMLVAMFLVSLVALLGGHLLGGPTLGHRGALAVASAVRHPGLAMMYANAITTDKRVTAAILAFMLVGLAAGAPYQMWLKRRVARDRAAAQAQADAGSLRRRP